MKVPFSDKIFLILLMTLLRLLICVIVFAEKIKSNFPKFFFNFSIKFLSK